jgi:hypothetical protein
MHPAQWHSRLDQLTDLAVQFRNGQRAINLPVHAVKEGRTVRLGGKSSGIETMRAL